jgi:hypothetical protein
MKVRHIVLGLLAAAMSGCSAQNQLMSEEKHDIDKQKEAQKQLIDRRTNELKEDVQQRSDQSVRALDTEDKQLDLQKHEIFGEKNDVRKRADFLKKDIDQQAETCKKTVDLNAQTAKEQINQSSHAVHQ